MRPNLFWLVCVWCGSALGSGRHKRIINGEMLSGHEIYLTNFMVSVRESWGCELARRSNQRMPPFCEGVTRCGGALIHPQFVVTACHCMMYSDFRFIVKPKFSLDPKMYADRDRERTEDLWRTIRIHGMLTTVLIEEPFRSMAMHMGSVINSRSHPQSRSVKGFFPHSKCIEKLPQYLTDSKDSYVSGADIGLIMGWYPFELTHDVGIAWFYHKEHLYDQYLRVREKQQSCLFLGFGKTDSSQWEAPTLNHMFGHIKCVENCPNPTEDCAICSSFVGSRVRYFTEVDSGGPVVCDRIWLFGVISSGHYDATTNSSLNRIAPLLCLKSFISKEYLTSLVVVADDYYKVRNASFGGRYGKRIPEFKFNGKIRFYPL